MLDEICAYLHNYFDRDRTKYYGEFTIEDGELVSFSNKLLDGQYFRIIGSTFNDGVYQFPAIGLTDETFDGAIWSMAVPPDLIKLIEEMEKWQTDNAYALSTPYQSENKADYGYTIRSSGNSQNGGAMTAINQFSGRLARWRKI